MRAGLRRALAAGLLCLATSVGARPVTLDATAMRQLAWTALQAGFAADALRYTDALLARDAGDVTALTIKSQAQRALGQYDAARHSARRAWRGADSPPARFGVSMAMAQALSSVERRGAAQWWLRRAAQNAPNPRAEAVARRDFGYVKSRNPWEIQISAYAAPKSNVNNGSRRDSLTLAGLPFEFEVPPGAKALAGFEAGLGVRASYRLAPQAPDRRTRLRFAALHQGVILSDAARMAAPALSGSDFAYGAVEAGLDQTRSFGATGQVTLQFGATGGRNWHGGTVLSDYVQLRGGVARQLSATSQASLDLSGDRVVRIDSPVQSSDRIEARAGFGHTVGTGDRFFAAVTVGRSFSDAVEIDHRALGLTLGWTKAEVVAGLGLSAGLELEARTFDQSRYVTGGREDLRLTANLSMAFEKVDYMGFSPVVDVRATRNRSNAALYDTQDFSVVFGIRSSF